MTYTHIIPNELVIIEAYFHQGKSVSATAKLVKRCRQTLHTIFSFFKQEYTALAYLEQYFANKKRCGRRKIILPLEQQNYITEMTKKGGTPDIFIGRKERIINCSSRTLYRRFKDKIFDVNNLPLKEKIKLNEHQDR